MTYGLVTWKKDGGTIYVLSPSNCSPFGGQPIDPTEVEVTCTNNDFSLTFKEVKRDQGGERWLCHVNTDPETVSAEVTIKIKGRIISLI